MTKAKRFVRWFAAMSLALLLLIAAAVYIIDPLYMYHLPWFGLSMPLFYERYQNAGLVRQMEFDSILIGSSSVQNFRASWLEKAFHSPTMKLTFSSGYLSQYDMALSLIYSRQPLTNVFLCLDMYALSDGSDYAYYPSPPYLYDTDPWNDVKYLLNRDVLTDVLPQFFWHQKDNIPFEDAYSYADRAVFGREAVLQRYPDGTPSLVGWNAQLPRDAYVDACASALARVTKHIAAHPETTYYIFMPPYSILNWMNYIECGQVEAIFGAIDKAANILLAYDNVRLFCYMGLEEIITDLDRYYDIHHYDRAACEELVAYMAAGRDEMTKENHAAFVAALEDFVWNYDYEALFDG